MITSTSLDWNKIKSRMMSSVKMRARALTCQKGAVIMSGASMGRGSVPSWAKHVRRTQIVPCRAVARWKGATRATIAACFQTEKLANSAIPT